MNRLLVGISVECTVCHHSKQPWGRSAPMGCVYCDANCPGYRLDPLVGDLWPGERREDFGYSPELVEIALAINAKDALIAELEEKLKDLTWRVVANAGRLSEERKPRWGHVMDATANGSTVSWELCVGAGFDPDENRGGPT